MLTNYDSIQALFNELGPATPDIDAIVQDEEEQSWAVQFDNDSVVQIEWMEEDPPRLLFLAPLGRPRADMQSSVYTMLLRYNLFVHQTKGVRTALSGPEDDVMLVRERWAEQLSLTQLQAALAEFTELAATWGNYVTSEAKSDALPSGAAQLCV